MVYAEHTFGGLKGYSAGKIISILKAPALNGIRFWIDEAGELDELGKGEGEKEGEGEMKQNV